MPALDGLQGSARADLLDTLYEAPCNPDVWSQFLGKMVNATRSRSARMLVMDRQAQTVLSSIKHNIDDRAHQDYVAHYVNACPWRPELKHKAAGQLYSTYLDFSCPQKRFYRTEFYNDWARQQDIHHGVCGTVWQDDDYTIQLLIQRTGGQGHYNGDETGQINGIVAHMRRALRLQSQTHALEQQRQGLADALDIQPYPFALLTRQGKLVHISNDAHQRLLEHPLASLHNGYLTLRSRRLQGQLMAQLQQVTRPDPAQLGDGGLITLHGENGQPLRCLIAPLRPDHTPAPLWQASPQALAIIYLYDAQAEIEIDLQSLMTLFELSEAEARVAAGIARGFAPQELAREFGLSHHTIRTQLKAAFHKTGTNRQSELAKLVLTSPATRRWRRPPIELSATSKAG
ncbi:helix-turn-helix transcriptional regulator [Alcanivorax hongdengensis]|nr:helix-turn-helix transcriptional regulator [Alcanivorax hongdengensis]